MGSPIVRRGDDGMRSLKMTGEAKMAWKTLKMRSRRTSDDLNYSRCLNV